MRRIVLFDKEEVKDYYKYYGCGLGDEIYSLQSLVGRPEEEVFRLLSIGSGDGVLLVGVKAFEFLRKFYHYGIRNENFSDCTKLARLSISGGAFVKCIKEFPTQDVINYFLSTEFSTHRDFSWYKQKILHTYEEVIRFLDWLDCRPSDTMFGFDYEGSGMPLDKWYELSGASICTIQYGGFISFTDLRRNTSQENYNNVLNRLGRFLELRQDHIWVYNMQYEFQVSHRMLGVTLYNLCDASTVNVLDGNHLMKKYSLKWTANYVLGSTVWDTEFDRISDLVEKIMFRFIPVPRTKKMSKELKDPGDIEGPEWEELKRSYPDYIDEFYSLFTEYWGFPFMCIPSNILGHYCNLDAFYTLMIFEQRRSAYSDDAWKVFLDNTRLGSLLMSSGLYIDEEFRKKYEEESLKMMAWGITYCATARCKIRMEVHRKSMASIKKFPEITKRLIKSGNFYSGDPKEITKYILSNNIDVIDAYELGINEGAILMNYGPEFAANFMSILRESMVEAGMIKTKKKTGEVVITRIDQGITKKKKIIEILSTKMIPLLGLDKIKLGKRLEELEEFCYYERAYQELQRVTETQINNIYSVPMEITAFGMEFGIDGYCKYISDNYFKCKSPEENDMICLELASLFPAESAYLAALMASTQQLPETDHYYSAIGINDIDTGFEHFRTRFNDWYEGKGGVDYPEKVFKLALEYVKDLKCDSVKEVWSNFLGYNAQEQFFKNTSEEDQIRLYEEPFSESDLQGSRFFFMRKMVINYLLYKKYSKVLSTYIRGMFKANNIWCIENPKTHIPLRLADPDEPGAVEKCMVKYEVNTKSSKRWSSGFHTIISHADLKDCITVPPEYDVYGNRQSFIMTYFDISSAEVKAAGYASGDPDLIDKFNKGEDIKFKSIA